MSEKKVTIESIESTWAIDSKIDKTDLNTDSSKQLELHSKYHRILNWARRKLRQLQAEKARLINLKTEWLTNQMAPAQLKELGWEPNRRAVLKNEVDRFLEADQDIIALNLEIGDINDIIAFVESIIKAIYQKPFITKNIIENNKFINGIN